MTLLEQLELAGLLSAVQHADGAITVTIQAGLIDPREAVEAAQKDGRTTALGGVQKVVFRTLCELTSEDLCEQVPIDDVYDTARAELPMSPKGKRDTRNQVIKRAMEKLYERGYITIRDDMLSIGATTRD